MVAGAAIAPPRVAAVVVHYGDPAPTRRCLDSLSGIDEVILVDQPPHLVGEHPRITRRITPGANVGFAAACNRAVEAAQAPFVLLINNDAVLASGAAECLADVLAVLPPDVAGASLKLLFPDGTTLQSATGLWFTRDGIGFPRGFGETDSGQYDYAVADEIGVPSGAAAVYRTDAWREAGGMCEDFFCYCEDGDLGLRLVAAGYRFAWLPDVRVLHELSSATSAHSAFKALHVERNHFAVMLHSAPLRSVVALPAATVMRIARTMWDAGRGRGGGAGLLESSSPMALAAALARAWTAAFAAVPAALERRRDLATRHPDGIRRVAQFLAQRRVPLTRFLSSRTPELGTGTDSAEKSGTGTN